VFVEWSGDLASDPTSTETITDDELQVTLVYHNEMETIHQTYVYYNHPFVSIETFRGEGQRVFDSDLGRERYGYTTTFVEVVGAYENSILVMSLNEEGTEPTYGRHSFRDSSFAALFSVDISLMRSSFAVPLWRGTFEGGYYQYIGDMIIFRSDEKLVYIFVQPIPTFKDFTERFGRYCMNSISFFTFEPIRVEGYGCGLTGECWYGQSDDAGHTFMYAAVPALNNAEFGDYFNEYGKTLDDRMLTLTPRW
jgi:hypothetical protein